MIFSIFLSPKTKRNNPFNTSFRDSLLFIAELSGLFVRSEEDIDVELSDRSGVEEGLDVEEELDVEERSDGSLFTLGDSDSIHPKYSFSKSDAVYTV